MLKPGLTQHCHISHKGDEYTFHNFRDFSRTREDSKQKQNWREEIVQLKKMVSLDMYISPFMLHDLIGHTAVTFGFSDGRRLCLSVEAELEENEEYNLLKGFLPGYRIRYIRGTEKDIMNLRIFRHEKVIRYPVHLSKEHITQFFLDLIEETNKAENKTEKYQLLFNNCTSGLRNTARKHFAIKRWHYGLVLNAFLPKFLHKL